MMICGVFLVHSSNSITTYIWDTAQQDCMMMTAANKVLPFFECIHTVTYGSIHRSAHENQSFTHLQAVRTSSTVPVSYTHLTLPTIYSV